MAARRTTTLLSTAALVLTASACGSALDPQTYKSRTSQDSANANVGRLALRNAAILPPANGGSELAIGADALATLAVVSTSQDMDTLMSVTTPAASAVQLVDGSGHAVPAVEVPALGSVGPQDFGLVLKGLTTALRPGSYVDMTFAFAKSGTASFKVPVKVYDVPVPRDSYAPKAPEE